MAAEYNRGRNHISSTKINYFHYVLKQLTGYTVHPEITRFSQPVRVADFGTQTAVWPIDVVENSLDDTEVDGFDISGRFFPPFQWLPSKVKLHLHDIFEPFPEQFVGRFDMIHIRMFLNLSQERIRNIVSNAMTLLKPGGFVQWTEHDKTAMHPIAISSDLSTTSNEAFIALQHNPFPNYNYRWVLDIAPAMESAGMGIIAQDRIPVKHSLLHQMNELHLLSIMDVPEGLSQAMDEYREQNLQRLVEEYDSGVSTVDGFICVVGRKLQIA